MACNNLFTAILQDRDLVFGVQEVPFMLQLQEAVLVCVPLPQVALQSDHAPKAPQTQTGVGQSTPCDNG